jgi:branched-chain amino acid transport system ATP-binding protein
MISALLAIEKLEVVYQRAITAVQGITLAVEAGQIVALLGTNGAGKSTTLRAISGFLGLDDARVTEGTISFKGTRIENRPPHENTRRGIVLVPERDKVFPNLTVAENLIAPVPRGTSLAEHRGARLWSTSSFRGSASSRPASAGCSPAASGRCWRSQAPSSAGRSCCWSTSSRSASLPSVVEDLLRRLIEIRRELGITILIVEQSATVALEIADYGYVMENGRIVLDGTAERLRSHPDIQEFYLGSRSGERRNYRDVKQYRRSRRWYG